MTELSEEQKNKIFDIVNSNKSVSISLLCSTLSIDYDTLITYAETNGFVVFDNKILLPEEMERIDSNITDNSLIEQYTPIITPVYPIIFRVSASTIIKRSLVMMLFAFLSCTVSQVIFFIILYMFGQIWIFIILSSLILIGYFLWFFSQIRCMLEIYPDHFVYRKGLTKRVVSFDTVLAVQGSRREIVLDRGKGFLFREIRIKEHSIVLEYNTSLSTIARIDLRPFSFDVGLKIHSIVNDQIRLYYNSLMNENQKIEKIGG